MTFEYFNADLSLIYYGKAFSNLDVAVRNPLSP